MKPLSVAAALCASAVTAPAFASTEAAHSWPWLGILAIYLLTIGGTTPYPSTGGGSGVGVDAATILHNPKMAFMRAPDARKGQWGVFSDVLWRGVRSARVRPKPSTPVSRPGPPRRVAATATRCGQSRGLHVMRL